MDGQIHPISITDFVRNVRGEAEAAVEAELETNESDCCDSCHRKCPEDDFQFGSYRSDLCRSCVKRITEDKNNKKHPVIRLSRDIRQCLRSSTRPGKLVDRLEDTWNKFLDIKEANDNDMEYMNSILQNTTAKTIDSQSEMIMDLKERNQELSQENAGLEYDKERLQKGIERLKQDNEKRKNVIESLNKIKDALEKDNANLMQLKGKIEDEVSSVKEQFQILEGASVSIDVERIRLAEQAKELEQAGEEVRKELEKEKAEHNKLKETLKTALGL